MGESDQEYYTVKEVAALLRISRMTVYRLMNAGTLPAVRVGRSYRISDSALNAYLAGCGVADAP